LGKPLAGHLTVEQVGHPLFERPPIPACSRGRIALLVAPQHDLRRSQTGHGAAQHSLGPALMNFESIGQSKRELYQAIVQKRRARLDGKGHAVAIFVAQKLRNGKMGHIVSQPPRQAIGPAGLTPFPAAVHVFESRSHLFV